MSKRLPSHLWRCIRERVLERDGHACQKCGRPTNLQVHHIIALFEGGSDEDTNLITLCYPCHVEWEIFEAVYIIPFEEWLIFPPFTILFPIYMFAEKHPELLEKLSAKEMHECIKLLHDETKQTCHTNKAPYREFSRRDSD